MYATTNPCLLYTACDCDSQGSLTESCNKSGMCICKSNNIEGEKCSKCAQNLYNFPNCIGKVVFTLKLIFCHHVNYLISDFFFLF